MPRNYATLAGVLFFGQVRNPGKGGDMNRTFRRLLRKDEGQDIAEYAACWRSFSVIVLGTIRQIGCITNTDYSQVASSIP